MTFCVNFCFKTTIIYQTKFDKSTLFLTILKFNIIIENVFFVKTSKKHNKKVKKCLTLEISFGTMNKQSDKRQQKIERFDL